MLDPVSLFSICIPSQQSLLQIRWRLKLTNLTDIYKSEVTHRNSAIESLSLGTLPAGFSNRIHQIAIYHGQKDFSHNCYIQDFVKTLGSFYEALGPDRSYSKF